VEGPRQEVWRGLAWNSFLGAPWNEMRAFREILEMGAGERRGIRYLECFVWGWRKECLLMKVEILRWPNLVAWQSLARNFASPFLTHHLHLCSSVSFIYHPRSISDENRFSDDVSDRVSIREAGL
jgi:hypothetical protein